MYDGELDKVGAGDPADIVPLTQYYADPGRAVFITGVGTISDSYGPVALSANGRFAVVSMRKAFPVVEYYENATLPGVGGYFTGTSTAKNNAFTYGPFQYAVFNTDTGGYDVLINSEAEGDLACVDDSGQCYGNDSSGHAAKVFINGMRMLPGLFWVAGGTHDGLAVIGSLVDNSVDSFPAILIDGHIVGLPAGFRAVGSIASF
jgi:F0F1-type ATP synthase assembly protein I